MSDRFLMPWEDTSLTSWYPRRRRVHTSPWRHVENLWEEAMNEVECLQSALGRQVGGRTLYVNPWQSSIESHWEGDENSPGKYMMKIPLGHNIQPEDLKVSLKEEGGLKVMSVEAKKEQKSQDGSQRVYQEYSRRFTLPKEADMKEIKSVLHPDGYLKIECAMPQLALKEEEPKEIPIEMARVG